MMGGMEELLRQHLGLCAVAFERAAGLKASIVSRRAVQDSRYLDRVIGGSSGFTVATYDRLMAYFSAHWPEEAAWPEGAPRPNPSEWARIEAERIARASSNAPAASEQAA
jgi:hypothetical protein